MVLLLLLLLILFGGSSSSSSGASRRFPSGRLAIRIRGVGHFPEHRGGVMFRRHDTTTNAHTSSRANTSRLSLSSKRPPPTPQKRSSSTTPLSLRLKSGGGLLLFFEGAQVKVPSREVMATKRRLKEREDPTEKRRGLFRVSKRSKKERKISANFFIPFNDFLRTLRRRRRRLSEDDVRRRRTRRRRTGGSPLGALSFSLFLFFSFFLSAFFRWPRSFRERVKNVAVKRKRL